MSRWCREKKELRETEETIDGIVQTRIFRIAEKTAKWLQEYGTLAAIMVCPPSDYGFWAITVEGSLENNRWTGWDWIWNEFTSAGMNPEVYGL